jgi:hypothetical protein
VALILDIAIGSIGGYLALGGHWRMGAVLIFAMLTRRYNPVR